MCVVLQVFGQKLTHWTMNVFLHFMAIHNSMAKNECTSVRMLNKSSVCILCTNSEVRIYTLYLCSRSPKAPKL